MRERIGLFVATPVHGQVSMHYTSACLNLQETCFQQGIPITFCLQQDSVLTQNRNRCVAQFLKTDATFTHFLFIDSDIYFHPQSILQMIAVDREVISMPYPQKHINYEAMFEQVKEGKIKSAEDLRTAGYQYPVKVKNDQSILDKHGVMEISHAPTGTLLIQRHVFHKLIHAYPELKIKGNVKEPYYNFFDFYHDKKSQSYYGEDFGFSKLWSDLGGKIYAYIMDEVAHIGDHIYYGKMYDNLSYRRPIKDEEVSN